MILSGVYEMGCCCLYRKPLPYTHTTDRCTKDAKPGTAVARQLWQEAQENKCADEMLYNRMVQVCVVMYPHVYMGMCVNKSHVH